MSAPTRFAEFLGNPGVVRIVRQAIARGRLPHAMIFAGPEGVGKRALATLLARRINCLDVRDDEPCGRCASCRKLAAGNHPDFRLVEPDGTGIRIEQVRALAGEIAFEPFEARYRVAVLDPADSMRQEAANSLLKTLEEPASRTYLVLLTTSPYALLPTIRSRSRQLQFGAIPEEAIAHYLERAGREPAAAWAAARSSHGSLGLALAFDAEVHAQARRRALEFAAVLFAGGGFAEASRLAAEAARDKDREKFEAWLAAVESVLRDVYYGQMAPERVREVSAEDEVRGLSGSVSQEDLVRAVEGLARLRRALRQNVNRQVALEAFFVAWSREARPRRSVA